ncbi:hypothetical protein OIU74_026281 [Salix koriyanagi]|uniref:Uncharacterized protein n=1 Tax=Salix koriyanagi TaxID=2511006 RepID=A0A9Q1A3J2_9ROSI|nr:hypothetical protein OIU74_026281 [Salix koriyanagi]
MIQRVWKSLKEMQQLLSKVFVRGTSTSVTLFQFLVMDTARSVKHFDTCQFPRVCDGTVLQNVTLVDLFVLNAFSLQAANHSFLITLEVKLIENGEAMSWQRPSSCSPLARTWWPEESSEQPLRS